MAHCLHTALLAGLLASSLAGTALAQAPAPKVAVPIAADNAISNMTLTWDADGDRSVWIEYVYVGAQGEGTVHVQLYSKDAQTGELRAVGPEHTGPGLAAGKQKLFVSLSPPPGAKTRLTWVGAELRIGSKVIARQQMKSPIDWASPPDVLEFRPDPKRSNNELLQQAVELIDSGGRASLRNAKILLERITLNDPRADAAYVELARVAMKTDWSANGLGKAEALLKSALQIKPDSDNAKILLGYVHAHQRRYTAAEALFQDAARSEPRNLWLWANWGELLAMQGQRSAAIVKYREALSRPRTHDTYDRARLDAYRNLLGLLDQDGNLGAMEAVHRQRTDEFGKTTCVGGLYAHFLLYQKHQPGEAIKVGRATLDAPCEDTVPRDVLGAAYYTAWAATRGPKRDSSLSQARLFLPVSPRALYVLATSNTTAPAAKQLVTHGEVIDQRDNVRMTALAYAMQADNLQAARRLLDLGAKPTATVGPEELPLALLPVMRGSIGGIRLMQGAGVDYANVRYRGTRAMDIAREMGIPNVVEALEGKGKPI